MKKIILAAVLGLLSFDVFAEVNMRWVDRTVEVKTQETNAVIARKNLLESATEKASLDLIKEIIGEGKFTRNLPLIRSKVLKISSRYVPVVKPQELEKTDDGFKMAVELKISQDDLQAVLLENGLFYESDSMPLVLPLVTIHDRMTDGHWSWWTDGANVASPKGQGLNSYKVSKELEVKLRSSFWNSGFYVERPIGYHFFDMTLPAVKSEIANVIGAPIFVDGEISVEKNSKRSDSFMVNIHLMAVQVQNQRSIAEVNRDYETESGKMDFVVAQKLNEVLDGVCGDLAGQVLEAWQKGALGSDLFRLSISGSIPIDQREAIKDELREHLREVKNVRERLIAADEYVLEVDSNLTPKEFIAKVPNLKVGNLSIVASGFADKEVRYKVAAKTEEKK